jgi:hypothetical protein
MINTLINKQKLTELISIDGILTIMPLDNNKNRTKNAC